MMASQLFTLTAYDLTWLTRARSGAELAQRVAALAARSGTTVQAVQDAIWASGVVDGLGASSAAVRATAQAAARGAARRVAELGGRTVVRQAARQVAAHGVRTTGATILGGLGATVGTLFGVTMLIGVLAVGAYAANRVYTTYQQRAHQPASSVERFSGTPDGRTSPQPSGGSRTWPGVPARNPSSDANLYSPRNILGPHVDDHGRDIPGARERINHGGHLEFKAARRGEFPGR